MQAYSNPSRECSPTALPDIEVFHMSAGGTNPDGMVAEDPTLAGWYWWSCFSGCLPDSEPNGPFKTEALALADAQERD